MSELNRLRTTTRPVPTTQTQLIDLMRERESRQQQDSQHERRRPAEHTQDEARFHIDEYA